MANPETTVPSEAEIAALIAKDPTIAAEVMCLTEDGLIAAQKEIKRLQRKIRRLQERIAKNRGPNNPPGNGYIRCLGCGGSGWVIPLTPELRKYIAEDQDRIDNAQAECDLYLDIDAWRESELVEGKTVPSIRRRPAGRLADYLVSKGWRRSA